MSNTVSRARLLQIGNRFLYLDGEGHWWEYNPTSETWHLLRYSLSVASDASAVSAPTSNDGDTMMSSASSMTVGQEAEAEAAGAPQTQVQMHASNSPSSGYGSGNHPTDVSEHYTPDQFDGASPPSASGGASGSWARDAEGDTLPDDENFDSGYPHDAEAGAARAEQFVNENAREAATNWNSLDASDALARYYQAFPDNQ